MVTEIDNHLFLLLFLHKNLIIVFSQSLKAFLFLLASNGQEISGKTLLSLASFKHLLDADRGRTYGHFILEDVARSSLSAHGRVDFLGRRRLREGEN